MMIRDILLQLNEFILKYDFSREDMGILFDRILMFGEAVSMLEELGLSIELEERHEEKCKKAMEMMAKF